jgi:hypothetical protein
VALNENGMPGVRINHRSQFNAEMVKQTLGLSHNKIEKFKEAAEFLGSKRYDEAMLQRFMAKVFGESSREDKVLSRTAQQAMEFVENQPGDNFRPGTWWNAYNAVTYMTDHKLCRSQDTRLTAAWFGGNAKRKVDALDLALEMADAA